MPHQKLIRELNYFWLLVVFPVAVAILIGVLGHSANLGIKTLREILAYNPDCMQDCSKKQGV